jgi:hypothetical protein
MASLYLPSSINFLAEAKAGSATTVAAPFSWKARGENRSAARSGQASIPWIRKISANRKRESLISPCLSGPKAIKAQNRRERDTAGFVTATVRSRQLLVDFREFSTRCKLFS